MLDEVVVATNQHDVVRRLIFKIAQICSRFSFSYVWLDKHRLHGPLFTLNMGIDANWHFIRVLGVIWIDLVIADAHRAAKLLPSLNDLFRVYQRLMCRWMFADVRHRCRWEKLSLWTWHWLGVPFISPLHHAAFDNTPFDLARQKALLQIRMEARMNEYSCCSSRYEFLFLVKWLFDDIGIRTIT